MEYKIVSADSHIDMSWLPGDLFSKNVPAHLRDKVPQVMETPAGPRWVAEGRRGFAGPPQVGAPQALSPSIYLRAIQRVPG